MRTTSYYPFNASIFRFRLYKADHTRNRPYWRAQVRLTERWAVVRYVDGTIVNMESKSAMQRHLRYAYEGKES